MTDAAVLKRFMSFVRPQFGGCWLWGGGKNKKGYGQFFLNSRRLAHRVSYELFVGPIPDKLCVLHTCDAPSCVNPNHLWLGTNQDNINDRVKKGRKCSWPKNLTNCKRGHNQYDPVKKRCKKCEIGSRVNRRQERLLKRALFEMGVRT